MSVTIKDVAREVGVAPSTVSRTLQNHPSISKETKEKVRKAMDKLGYVPNVAARNLAKKFSNAIGVVFPVLSSTDRKSNPFYLEAITAMNQEAGKQDVTISFASGETLEELLENVQLMYRQKRVDGFILLYVRKNDPVLTYLVENNIPHTVIGQPYQYSNGTSCVDNDNQLLGRTATQYLIEKGHERILFVTNYEKENVFQERFYGYQKSMEESELNPLPYVVLKQPEDYTAFEKILKEQRPTACIAVDDMFALRVIQLANLYGYQVPDNLSVISFNNSIFTTLIHPYITSIDIHTEELGKVAVQQFLLQLKEQEVLKQKVLIPHTLIERETVLDLKKASKTRK
ncbi:LacI family DNA-binding transcriptional regulator [Enterococcus sp. LJL128]